MSPATASAVPPVAAPDAPSLSEAICGLLSILGANGNSELALIGRTVDGFAQLEDRLKAPSGGWIPKQILDRLEAGVWSLHVGLALRRPGAVQELTSVNAIAVEYQLTPAQSQRSGVLDPAEIDAARQRIDRFGVTPSVVVHSGSSIAIVWRLSAPIDVRTEPEQIRVMDVIRRVASAIGAHVPGDDVALKDVGLPMPGSLVREWPFNQLVTVPHLEAERVTTIEALEDAIRDQAARVVAESQTTNSTRTRAKKEPRP